MIWGEPKIPSNCGRFEFARVQVIRSQLYIGLNDLNIGLFMYSFLMIRICFCTWTFDVWTGSACSSLRFGKPVPLWLVVFFSQSSWVPHLSHARKFTSSIYSQKIEGWPGMKLRTPQVTFDKLVDSPFNSSWIKGGIWEFDNRPPLFGGNFYCRFIVLGHQCGHRDNRDVYYYAPQITVA